MRYFVTLLFLCAPLAAQTSDSDRQTLQSLLTEVQQLRQAIERSTLLGTRTQIAMERLQVEDARVSRAAQELEKARKEVSDVQFEQTRIANRIKQMEEELTRTQDANHRADIENGIKGSKLELEQLAAMEGQKRAREAELTSEVQTGRGRLTELEGRITDMERAIDAVVRQLGQAKP